MKLTNYKNMFPLSPTIEFVPTPANKTGLWRFLTPVLRENLAPCRALCPLESAIPLWMEKVAGGDWEGAWKLMEQFNPFPALTGYACYQFCRSGCNREKWDEAVAIRDIEKALGQWRHKNYRLPGTREDGTGKKSAGENGVSPRVVVIGSGPSGLSCAYYLNRMGAEVTILESEPVAGGLLATGIPDCRLPREILDRELEILQGEGIAIRCGTGVNGGLLNDLAQQYDAILLAVGASRESSLGVPGDDHADVTGALSFLKGLNFGHRSVPAGTVVVIGGGNAAVDAASAAARGGAKDVFLIYRRSEEVMPAHPEEVKAARDAGVKFLFNMILDRIHGSGAIEKVSLSKVQPTQRGEKIRRIPGTELVIKCQMVIGATGQQSNLPGLISLPEVAGGDMVSFRDKGCFLLAAGDALTGPSNLASAIFSGRLAALKLAQALWPRDFDLQLPAAPATMNKAEPVSFTSLNPYLYSQHRVLMHPQEEADRCFGCGTCRSCGVCWAFCPDLAVKYLGGIPEFNLDYCKGCGICVAECPTGVLSMEEVDDPGN